MSSGLITGTFDLQLLKCQCPLYKIHLRLPLLSIAHTNIRAAGSLLQHKTLEKTKNTLMHEDAFLIAYQQSVAVLTSADKGKLFPQLLTMFHWDRIHGIEFVLHTTKDVRHMKPKEVCLTKAASVNSWYLPSEVSCSLEQAFTKLYRYSWIKETNVTFYMQFQ